MNMHLAQVVLHSKNPKLLGSFFSELLDKALVEKDSSFMFKETAQYPFLFTARHKTSKKPIDEFFFYLENKEQIKELEQKISFFCYRHDIKQSLFKVTSTDSILEIVDLDGRKWVFSIKQ